MGAMSSPNQVTESHMSDKVVINLATGLEDPERVTIAFLVAGAALEQGKQSRCS